MNLRAVLIVQRDIETEHEILSGGDIWTRPSCRNECFSSLAATILTTTQRKEALGRLEVVVELIASLTLHRRHDRLFKLTHQIGLRLRVLSSIDLLNCDRRKQRPRLHILRVGIGDLLDERLCFCKLVLHHRDHSQLNVHAFFILGASGSTLQIFERLGTVAIKQLKTHHTDKRIMVVRIPSEHLFV